MSESVKSYLHSRYEVDHSRRMLVLGLVLSFLMHLAFWGGAAEHLLALAPSHAHQPATVVSVTEVAYEPLAPKVPQPERDRPEYIEANPAAAQNEPDQTNQESNRNQQAAQEKPDPLSQSPKPSVEGTERDSSKVVNLPSGEPTPAELPAGIYTDTPGKGKSAQEQAAAADFAPPPAPPDFLLQKPVSEEGPGSTEQDPGKNKTQQKDAKPRLIDINRAAQQLQVSELATNRKVAEEAAARGVVAPKPRPTLHVKTVPGPLMNQPVRAGRMGVVAVDSKYSDFGDYQGRMVEAVSSQWNLLGERSNLADGNLRTKVVVEFWIDPEGYVHDVRIVYTSATRPATLICQDAILSRAPFGDWTEAMKTAIGEKMEIRFSFFYN